MRDATIPRDSGSSGTLDHEESFEWPTSDEDVFADAELAITSPETPRKAAKTVQFPSPGKRRYTQMESDDLFSTPSTSRKTGLLSPDITPAIDRTTDGDIGKDLVSEVLDLLSFTNLTTEVQEKLVTILNRHELRFQGIARGRDISRLAIKSKDKQIAELQARINGLEAERDTNKRVIAHLKHDISTPKKKRG